MIGLILVDIDGTLVGAGNRVHQANWDAISMAQASDVKVAICTGRPCSGHAQSYAERVDALGAHIFQSGAAVCRPSGELLHAVSMARSSYEGLVHLARELREPLEVYTATECFVERPNDYTRAHAEIIGLDVTERDLLAIDEPIIRVQWISLWADWPAIEVRVAADSNLAISVASQPDIVETCFSSVTAKGISKTSGALWLANSYGLGLDRVAMVGDGDNDLDIISSVGLGVAMANATPNVLAAAHVIVGHVDDGGLAEAITYALNMRPST